MASTCAAHAKVLPLISSRPLGVFTSFSPYCDSLRVKRTERWMNRLREGGLNERVDFSQPAGSHQSACALWKRNPREGAKGIRLLISIS